MTALLFLLVRRALPLGLLSIFFLSGLPGRAAPAPVYRIQDPYAFYDPFSSFDANTLSRLQSKAFGINEYGIVVGYAETPDGRYRAFRWREDSYLDSHPPDVTPPGGFSLGLAINSTGRVVGHIRTSQPAPVNYRDLAFWGTERSAIVSAGTLGGFHSRAYGINAAGQVVGGSYTAGGAWHAYRTGPNRSIIPSTDDLGTLGGSFSEAYGINAVGDVIGWAYTAQASPHAFLWRDLNGNGRSDGGEMRDLGTFGGATSVAYAINAAGRVVGEADTSSGVPRAFRTAPLGNVNAAGNNLGTLGGPRSRALAINNLGHVVGTSQDAAGNWHAFLYTDETGMVDLNTRMDPTPEERPEDRWILTEATGINDIGQIVGWGTHRGLGLLRAFVLTPVGAIIPTPPSDVDLPWGGAAIRNNFLNIPVPKIAVPRDRLAIFRANSRQWRIRNYDDSSTIAQFGDGDPAQWRLVPADYLGTGFAQLAVFKKDTREWLVRRDDGTLYGPIGFGGPNDTPVPGNYLDPRRAQIAVYRSNGEWYLRAENGGTLGPYKLVPFAEPTDIPVPADYLGSGRVQMAIFRQRTGQWYIRKDDGNILGPILQANSQGGIPVPGNYHWRASGHAQFAVYQPNTRRWYIADTDGSWLDDFVFGQSGDLPIPGAFSGSMLNGQYVPDIAVYRRSTREWIFLRPEQWWYGATSEAGALRIPWGEQAGDEPAAGAYRFRLGG